MVEDISMIATTTAMIQSLTDEQKADSPELGRLPFASWPPTGRPPGWYPLPLSPDAAAFYRQQGFIVVENGFRPDEIEDLRTETLRLCKGELGHFKGLLPYETHDSDDLIQSRYLCIHFPHKVSDTMKRFTAHPSYVEILTQIIGPNVKCMQSMLFLKGAGKPGQAWHQDEYYIPTRDRSLTGGWLAMDDATVENGCLWVIPGSHRNGILWPQERQRDRRFDCAGEATRFPYTVADSVPVEVKAGSIVFFNGYLLHRSLPNHAPTGFRRCLVNHYMSAESLLPWHAPQPGQSVATADYRDIIMIAGADPYEWKGTANEAKIHVRPSGEGGCHDGQKL
jgi:ectoine hydroxylase-related dioxygenase (phytanoyl-CoA dioxygenase family)